MIKLPSLTIDLSVADSKTILYFTHKSAAEHFMRQQYPAIILEIEATINNHEFFACSETFYETVSLFIANLDLLINQLWKQCKPKPGKRRFGKKDVSVNKISCSSLLIP